MFLGAAIIVALPEIFRDFQVYRLLAFGLLLMVLMIFNLLPVSRPVLEDDESARGRPPVTTERVTAKGAGMAPHNEQRGGAQKINGRTRLRRSRASAARGRRLQP